MNRIAFGIGLILGVSAVQAAEPNTLTDEEKADGWELLWDGKTTKGWAGVKSRCKTFPDHGWKIEDGVLSVVPRLEFVNGQLKKLTDAEAQLGGGGDIVTERTFKDFVFKVDFRTTPSANSGIKYYYDVDKNRDPSNGYGSSTEYQILDDSQPGSFKGLPADHRTGALYALKPVDVDIKKVIKPTGEWNTAMIVAEGSHVEHWLNGVKLLEYERGASDFREWVAKSKYATWGDQDGKHWGELARGHILLQDHSCQVAFRNVKVKVLTPRKRLLVIGAHPDDCDFKCGGTAAAWARAGHVVKFVCVTSGDTGHHRLSREETAARRKLEIEESRKALGIAEYVTLGHPCGVQATLENREELIRLIRNFGPDVIVTHRTCDYHPDHRATAQLVQDTAYVITVPHNCGDTPLADRVPVYAYMYDRFQEPRPLRIDAVVPTDDVLETKLAALRCQACQVFEWMPWDNRRKEMDVAKMSEQEIHDYLIGFCNRDKYQAAAGYPLMRKVLDETTADKTRYAECYEQSIYGSKHLPPDEFARLMLP